MWKIPIHIFNLISILIIILYISFGIIYFNINYLSEFIPANCTITGLKYTSNICCNQNCYCEACQTGYTCDYFLNNKISGICCGNFCDYDFSVAETCYITCASCQAFLLNITYNNYNNTINISCGLYQNCSDIYQVGNIINCWYNTKYPYSAASTIITNNLSQPYQWYHIFIIILSGLVFIFYLALIIFKKQVF